MQIYIRVLSNNEQPAETISKEKNIEWMLSNSQICKKPENKAQGIVMNKEVGS